MCESTVQLLLMYNVGLKRTIQVWAKNQLAQHTSLNPRQIVMMKIWGGRPCSPTGLHYNVTVHTLGEIWVPSWIRTCCMHDTPLPPPPPPPPPPLLHIFWKGVGQDRASGLRKYAVRFRPIRSVGGRGGGGGLLPALGQFN